MCYLVGPVVIFIYLMTVNIPLVLISLVPLILAVVVMGMMFRNTDDLMERANHSITTLNSVMIEYISGMKLIKAYNMGSKSFQKFSDAIQEENAMWNETSRRMGPPYAAFVVIIECGMLMMVPIGGMFFLKGSLAASTLLLFLYVGSMYLTEIRPLQELGTNFANVLNAITKTKEILDIPIYEGGTDFPKNHDIVLRNVRFSYDGKTDVLHGVNLKISDGERMALVGRSGAGKSTVIELISRFYDVQEGEVLIGGKNVKELDYDTILKNIAIVFQKTFLTRDSVLENIRMGSNATLEEVRAAAKEAQIDDFTVPDQKLTAIVGDSGSGKSTILNLIAKYYEATGGTISIGGKPINHVAAERVLEQVSMVDQDVFLFDDTIRDNIRHARPNATDTEIEDACREANCDSFIRKMEKGYDTPTGENGNLLSGGERQRISIARAILKNSPILLLDEATASLDIENELAVKQAIANLLKEKKTVVMIAHTLSIVKNADQILVMGDGRIAESGTHEELLAKGGKYAAMWNAEQKISA